MNIADGFQLWIGKELADLATAGFVLMALVVGVLIYAAIGSMRETLRRKGPRP